MSATEYGVSAMSGEVGLPVVGVHSWPGVWTRETPTVEDHPEGESLAWLVRGHPFNRPVLARTNVGVTRVGKGFRPFVVVQIMADGFYGMHLRSTAPPIAGLEWLGPILMPAH